MADTNKWKVGIISCSALFKWTFRLIKLVVFAINSTLNVGQGFILQQ